MILRMHQFSSNILFIFLIFEGRGYPPYTQGQTRPLFKVLDQPLILVNTVTEEGLRNTGIFVLRNKQTQN